jgi:hypothetical protein
VHLDEILPDRLREELTPAEQWLLARVAGGGEADFSAPDENQNDPTRGAAWGPDRTIRSAFLFWLCTNQQAAACVPPKGIRIRGARIESPLDFEGATLLHRLFLVRCAIPEGIVLTDARTRRLDLSGSCTQRIHADGLTVEGTLVLSSLICTGEVRLLGARIKGSLVCRGARLENPNGDALSAAGMTVEGGVFLDEGFHAIGEVRLLGARIRGQLSCRGARLENRNGDALSADGMTVEGDVFLDEEFHATGAVRLLGARIGGQLGCRGARLENRNGIALSAAGMTVEGDVFLDRGFHATGTVRLLGARIRGALVCTDARFEHPNGIALNLEHARLGVIEDDEGSWPQPGRLWIDGLEYEGFAGDRTPTDVRRRLEWLRRQLPDFRPQPYDQLAQVFRRMGREADAVEVLIAKQEDLIRHGKLSWWGRLTRRILGITIGHGYRSGRALLWSLAFVIAGALIFGWANARGLMAPSSPEILTDPLYRAGGTIPPDYPRFEALFYSLDAFLPIVDLHQESFWLPDAGKPFGALVRIYLWIHIAAGWFLSTLFVSGVTGLVRRLE